MVPARSVTVPTQAGRSIQFRQGMAAVNDTNDLPYLFGRSDVKVMITAYAMGWMDEVLSKTRQIHAEVHWPANYAVEHISETEYTIEQVEPPPPVDIDMLDEAIKEKPRWRKPPSNSSES